MTVRRMEYIDGELVEIRRAKKRKKEFMYIDDKIVEVRRAKKIKLKKKVGWKGNQNHPKKGSTHPIYPIKELKDIDNPIVFYLPMTT